MSRKVVAHLLSGQVYKGTSLDVDPSRPVFHVRTEDGQSVQLKLKDLKALFFVHSLEGNPKHNEGLAPDPTDTRSRGATIVKLKFVDGEIMVGMTIRYPPNRPFYYVVPVDTNSNNVRILVNGEAVVSIEPEPGGS